MPDRLPISRRTVLTAGALGALGTALPLGTSRSGCCHGHRPGRRRPRPRSAVPRRRDLQGVQFNDTQDDELTDRRTVELMEKVLDQEKPDFVVINGDVITGGCETRLAVKQAINNVVTPMESRRIPWAVTYGNHDEDSLPQSGVDEAGMLKIYRSYEYNVNAESTRGVTGTSNTIVSIGSAARKNREAFALWLMDSGRYAPGTIDGPGLRRIPDLGLAADGPGGLVPRAVAASRTASRAQGAGADVPAHRAVGAPLHVVGRRGHPHGGRCRARQGPARHRR